MAAAIVAALVLTGCSSLVADRVTVPRVLASPSLSATSSETRVPSTSAAAPQPAPAVVPARPGTVAGAGIVPPMESSVPVRVEIPAIGVDSTLVDLGLNADGTMEVPAKGFPAGWYTGAPTPGELGPAILAGHVDWAGSNGVFHDLLDLQLGDGVSVVRADGSTAVFRVTSVVTFAKDAFPTDRVYGNLDHAGLRLITCGGSWDASAGHYRDNVVVFAELVESRST